MNRLLTATRTEFGRISIADWLLTVTAAIPYVVGYLVGFLARLLLWLAAAVIAGFRDGLGQ